jgi:uncharacterized YigZ family protein
MFTLVKPRTHEVEIKKSRFIATAVSVSTLDEARLQIEAIRDARASHNCFAYEMGDQYRFSDDGEPGGTAGRPILNAIEAQGFDGVLVVVTRYFGGIKLGAGGLVRAYGGTAAECLRTAEKVEAKRVRVIELTAPFDFLGVVYSLVVRHDAKKIDETYHNNGFVLTVEIEDERIPLFEKALQDATRGQAVARVIEQS